jgi:hypothetical protein
MPGVEDAPVTVGVVAPLAVALAAARALSARRESAVTIPGTGFGVGKMIGVRIRTAAIRTTARAMRRGSMEE